MKIKDFFAESKDERITLASRKVASYGFYVLIALLLVNNVIKSYVLEYEMIYWIDTHVIVIASLVIVAIKEFKEGIIFSSVPKAEKSKHKIKIMLAISLGALYYYLTNGSIKMSDGYVGIIYALIFTTLITCIAYLLISKKI